MTQTWPTRSRDRQGRDRNVSKILKAAFNPYTYNWLVVLAHVLFVHILGIIIPTWNHMEAPPWCNHCQFVSRKRDELQLVAGFRKENGHKSPVQIFQRPSIRDANEAAQTHWCLVGNGWE